MTEDDLQQLYAQLLELSQNIPLSGRLSEPQASVTMVSPLCGSQITVDVVLDGDRLVQFAQKVRACTLGAAAASIVAAQLPGPSVGALRTLQREMRDMLKESGPPPGAPFEQLALLQPAQDLVSRHGSIMLVFDALCAALDEVEGVSSPAYSDKGIPDTMRA